MVFLSSLTLSLLVLEVTASKRSSWKYALKEAHQVPAKWTHISAAPSDLPVKVDIALKQGQFDRLEQELYEVSDPDSKRYGQHLSLEQVQDLVRPSSDTLNQVHDWLAGNGIKQSDLTYSPAQDWISVTIPVATLGRMLQTNYSIFQGVDGEQVVRTSTGNWSLPEHLHDHVDLISPTNSFFRPKVSGSGLGLGDITRRNQPDEALVTRRTASADSSIAAVCNTASVDMPCLRKYYGTYNYKPKAVDRNKVSLSNYLGESSNRSDTRIYMNKFRPDAAPGADTFKFQSINGGPTYQALNDSFLAQGYEVEGNLEIQTILGISYPTPVTVYSTGGTPPFLSDMNNPENGNEPYLNWLNYVLAQRDLPQSMSNSYDDDEQSVPYSYAKRVCEGMAQLGARGISVFFPSGDTGVGTNGTCISNDGRNARKFLPVFPPSCPYVTTVGGTMHFSPEVAAFDPPNNVTVGFSDGYSSGGGFSDYFTQPKYQKAAIESYIAGLGDQHKGLYNKNGRGYPDIAAQAVSIAVVWNNTLVHVDGTKCAISTAIFSLVNDALIASGRPPMGFLNPWLYKRGFQAMNDITSGSSVGCDTSGFPARHGWDAVTGFGSPMFKDILKELNLKA